MSGGYAKAKGREYKNTFVMVRHDLMDSPAWRSLSAKSQALWIIIRRRFNGSNNGDIPISCREAAKLLNIGKNTAAEAFTELQDRGFIKIGMHSSFTYKLKKSRRWIMTDESYNGRGPTNEWRKWADKN